MESGTKQREPVRNLLEELIALQAEHGHLRQSDLHALAERRRTPLHEIQGLVSFYPSFRTQPAAPIRIRACRDLACHLRDPKALASLTRQCATRDDVEIEPASCLGRCELAPACTVNDAPMTAERVAKILEAPSQAARDALQREPSKPDELTRSWQLDPHPDASTHYRVLHEWLARPERERAREIIERISSSDLRGMGGAGFPTGRKWELVADTAEKKRYVICNADESEPGTFKDRVILDELPHLVIEGMALAALAIDSHEGWVYVRHEYGPERRSLERALERARDRGVLGADAAHPFDIRVFVSPGGYILGEETALLEALEGRRGEPRHKPPFPGVRGLHGKPTLINNVETFAQVPRALETGRIDWKVFSVSGDVEEPQVVEAPLGTTVRELIARCGGIRGDRPLLAFLPGGASTGFLFAEHQDLPLDWSSLKDVGSSLGSAAVLVIAEGADLRALAGNLTAFFRNESCGKCVPCRIGTEKAVHLIGLRSQYRPNLLSIVDRHAIDVFGGVCRPLAKEQHLPIRCP